MNSFWLWVSVCTSSEKLTELFTSSETGGYISSEGTPHLKHWVSCSLHLKMEGYIWSEGTPHLKRWVSCSLHLKWGIYLIWGYTLSEKLSELFTSSETGGYISSEGTPHLKHWVSCSLHLKMAGYIWSQGTPHLKSWVSCSLHLKWGIYLIWGYTLSEKLSELFTSSETGGYISSEGTPHLKSWVSCSLHLKFGGGYIWSDGTLITQIYIYRSAKIGVVVCKESMLDWWGVHLPWVYMHCSIYIDMPSLV